MIFQLQDDHSRLAMATHVAGGETSEAALAVVKKGIEAHGVLQRLPTDNGVVKVGRALFSLTKRMGWRTVTATWNPESIVFANTDGTVIAEYLWPPEGTAYVGISRTRTRYRK